MFEQTKSTLKHKTTQNNTKYTGNDDSDAIATFSSDNTGVDGVVVVYDGTVVVSLDIGELQANNYSGIPDGADCFEGGLSWHIHEKWTHNSTDDSLDCGSDYTGGHWDPWLACGSATGNTYCESKGGCVRGSSVLGSDSSYDCSTFETNPYVCEVGDWSGKYGQAMVNGSVIEISGSSAFEVSGSDVIGYSIVFHCNDGTRAFCAPFVEVDEFAPEERPTQGLCLCLCLCLCVFCVGVFVQF